MHAQITAASVAAIIGIGAPNAMGEVPPPPSPVKVLTDKGAAATADGKGSVNAVCGAVAGASSGISAMTFVVEASATATSTGLAAPVATGVRCTIKDRTTGKVYGTVNGGLPGPNAAAAGTVTVPQSSHPVACVSSSAIFSNGSTASQGATC
jgi:hypothetical protein